MKSSRASRQPLVQYRNIYGYTTGSLEGITPTDTVNYTYGDAQWGDLLTAYDGQTITYDTIGNPLTQSDSEGNTVRSFQWQHGRQLAAMTVGGQTWTYTYNADGLRTSKTNGTATYQYIYDGSKLTQMVCGSNTLYFSYDAAGAPLTVTYNGTTYYYVTNVQGDVIAVLSQNGSLVASYAYDAWGNLLSIGGSLADTLGILNPLRYRSYVYDSETSLYYLQSRYYDPQIGRFLNADAYAATGKGFVGNNMFAYCLNNPTAMIDSCGREPITIGILLEFAPLIACTVFALVIVNSPQFQEDLVQFATYIDRQIQILIYQNQQSIFEEEEEEILVEALIPPQQKQQAYFTHNPNNFNPKGLLMVRYSGSYNGRIYKWMDPLTGAVIFEWNEDVKNGPHYHVMKAEWNGIHSGAHYLAGEPVPEPWNSIYFGSII